jgi:hypothetical protein
MDRDTTSLTASRPNDLFGVHGVDTRQEDDEGEHPVNLERGEQQPIRRCGVARLNGWRVEGAVKCTRAARHRFGDVSTQCLIPEGPDR